MRDDRFKIYIHRLREGEIETISESFEPTFMEVEEQELNFCSPIEVKGEAFVSSENFVLRLCVRTKATIACAICNEGVDVPLEVPSIVHTQKINELKSGVFQMEDFLREAILLGLPSRAECNVGSCPQREEIKKYFSKEK